jgi:hypothetical protein
MSEHKCKNHDLEVLFLKITIEIYNHIYSPLKRMNFYVLAELYLFHTYSFF